MAPNEDELIDDYRSKLLKAVGYLSYSYSKVRQLPMKFSELDQESLEVWESFSARFSRVTDLFLSKYIRHQVEMREPGFRGSTIDYLNTAEKFGLLSGIDDWIEIKKLRNVTAHEYSEEAFDNYVKRLLLLAPKLLGLEQALKK